MQQATSGAVAPERLYRSVVPETGALRTARVGRGPIGDMAISADGTRLTVTNYADRSVSVIDASTGAVVHTPLGTGEPLAVATGQRKGGTHGGRSYVATSSGSFDSIVVIDTDTAETIAAHPVALSIGDLAVDPARRRLYAARTGPSGVDLLAIDTANGPVGAVEVPGSAGGSAGCVRVSPNARQVYVAVHQAGGDLIVVANPDLDLLGTIEIGSTIRDVAVSPDGESVVVTSCDPAVGDAVDVVDSATNTVTGRFLVDGPVMQLTVSRDGDRAYLTTTDDVVVVCTRTHRVLDTIGVAGSPSCTVESPDGRYLYIAGYDGVVSAWPVPVAEAVLPDRFAFEDAVSRLLELEPAV